MSNTSESTRCYKCCENHCRHYCHQCEASYCETCCRILHANPSFSLHRVISLGIAGKCCMCDNSANYKPCDVCGKYYCQNCLDAYRGRIWGFTDDYWGGIGSCGHISLNDFTVHKLEYKTKDYAVFKVYCNHKLVKTSRTLYLKVILNTDLDLQDPGNRVQWDILLSSYKIIQHPNIIRILGVFQDFLPTSPITSFLDERLWSCRTSYCVIMNQPYTPLSDTLQKVPIPRPLDFIIPILLDIGRSLYFLYNENIILLELPLESIFLDQDGNVVIGNFSSAIRVGWKYKNHILSGIVPSVYHSPEILLSVDNNNILLNKHPTFSFGVLLYILCTNKHPLKDYKNYSQHKTLDIQQILTNYPTKFQDYAKTLITRKPEQRIALQKAIDELKKFIVPSTTIQKKSYDCTNNEYYDVIVKTKKETFYCLQSLLIQHCDFFKNYNQPLLSNNNRTINSTTTVYELEEESPYFGLLMKAIHSQSIEINQENVLQLCELSNYYVVEEVEMRCSEYLFKHLSIERIFDIYDYAQTSNDTLMIATCTRWLLQHAQLLLSNDEYRNGLVYESLLYFLSEDSVSINRERDLFVGIVKWMIDHEIDDNEMINLLSHIQWMFISEDYITKIFSKYIKNYPKELFNKILQISKGLLLQESTTEFHKHNRKYGQILYKPPDNDSDIWGISMPTNGIIIDGHTTITLSIHGKLYQSMKCLLCLGSHYFKELLQNKPDGSTVVCDDINNNQFELILPWFSFGRIKITPINVMSILSISYQLKVQSLEDEAFKFLTDYLPTEIDIVYKLYCDKNSSLFKQYYDIINNWGDILFQPQYCHILSNDEILSLLRDNKLTVCSEIQVLKGVIQYIKDNKCDLRKSNDLLQYINWKLIPYQYVINNVLEDHTIDHFIRDSIAHTTNDKESFLKKLLNTSVEFREYKGFIPTPDPDLNAYFRTFPSFQYVKSINLKGWVLDTYSVRYLIESLLYCCSLQELDLEGVGLGANGVMLLYDLFINGFFKNLELLNLSHNSIGSEGMIVIASLFSNMNFPALKKLDLSYNNINHDGIFYFWMQTKFNPFPNLTYLNLSGNPMDIYSIQLITNGLKVNAFGMLQVLLLNECYFENSGLIQLSRVLKKKLFPSLLEIGLNHNCCGDSVHHNKLTSLNDALRTGCCRHLMRVDLSNNLITPTGMQILCGYFDSIHSKNIQIFDVSYSGIGNDGVNFICQSLSSLASPKLIELSIADYKYSDKRITGKGLKYLFQLFEAKKAQTVVKLNISGAFVENDTIQYFVSLIKKQCFNNIKELYMKECEIKDSGSTMLRPVLAELTQLKTLDLSNNNLSKSEIECYQKTFIHIKNLYIDNNNNIKGPVESFRYMFYKKESTFSNNSIEDFSDD